MVLHQALDGVGCLGARKLFLFGLLSGDDRNGKDVFKEVGIAFELLLGLMDCLLGSLMNRMPLLPPELSRTQERTGRLLPADDGAPLVIEHRKLAVGLQHSRPVVAEHRLRRRTERQTLFKLLAAAHRNPCDLGSEAVDQLAFLFEQALRNQDRHCHILMSGLLELGVHNRLDILPDRIAIRSENRKALDRCIFHQLRLAADVGIPLRKIDLHVGDLLHFLLFRHNQ